jgi:hypothetical protein
LKGAQGFEDRDTDMLAADEEGKSPQRILLPPLVVDSDGQHSGVGEEGRVQGRRVNGLAWVEYSDLEDDDVAESKGRRNVFRGRIVDSSSANAKALETCVMKAIRRRQNERREVKMRERT